MVSPHIVPGSAGNALPFGFAHGRANSGLPWSYSRVGRNKPADRHRRPGGVSGDRRPMRHHRTPSPECLFDARQPGIPPNSVPRSAGNAAPFGFAHGLLIPACIESVDIPVGRHQPAGRGRRPGLDHSQSISRTCVGTVCPQSAGYHP